jgi:hypothetical protein
MEQQSHVITTSILQSQKNHTFLRELRSPRLFFSCLFYLDVKTHFSLCKKRMDWESFRFVPYITRDRVCDLVNNQTSLT